MKRKKKRDGRPIMPAKSLMKLRILLPYGVFAVEAGVSRIIVDTGSGSVGLLPHRMDCVAALIPGILVYETLAGGEAYLAVDEGILIKTGLDVLVSVRNAVGGTDLKRLIASVEKDFMVINEQEKHVRLVMSKVESAFIGRIAVFLHG